MAGVPAYYQPVKTIARHVLSGGDGEPWRLPEGESHVFAKEMAGPYVPYECIFNPLSCLLDAGWPPARLHLLVLDREPVSCLDSWMVKWAPRIGRSRVLENFVLSNANYLSMRSFAEAAGVPVTHFPYEASKRPDVTVPRLFGRLGLAERYHPQILSGWGEAGDLNSEHARIHYRSEPEAYVVAGLHGKDEGYRFRPRTIVVLTEAERAVADGSKVRDRYDESVSRFCDDLGIDARLRSELFD
jgi:hypothetical protein